LIIDFVMALVHHLLIWIRKNGLPFQIFYINLRNAPCKWNMELAFTNKPR
jgi:hypothetical protein